MGFFSNLPFLRRNAPEPAPGPEAEPAVGPEPEPEAAPVAAATPAPEPAAPAPPEPAAPTPAAPPAAPEVSSQARAQAEEIVRSVVAELPNFVTVAVVDSVTGQILAGQWAGHSGGALEVAAADAEIVRQTRQAMEALQLAPTEQLEDIVITLRRQLHLLQVLPRQGWLLYLAIRSQDTNLALARTMLRQHAS